MSLPTLTHLQFLILDILRSERKAGRDVRAELEEAKAKMSGPAFYQLMSRMEDARYVKGCYKDRVLDFDGYKQKVRQRWYEITSRGLSIHSKTLSFYLERSRESEKR